MINMRDANGMRLSFVFFSLLSFVFYHMTSQGAIYVALLHSYLDVRGMGLFTAQTATNKAVVT